MLLRLLVVVAIEEVHVGGVIVDDGYLSMCRIEIDMIKEFAANRQANSVV